MSATTPLAAPVVSRAVGATYVAFIGSGFAFASWASRIPQVRDRLDLSTAALGLVLLAIAAGSVLALPASGPVIARIGSRRMVAVMAVLLGSALVVASGGVLAGALPLLVLGLFLLGLANGAWDVAMNVHGAVVERLVGRTIMTRFHAGFSVGTVAGALLGTLLVALDVPVPWHLAVVGVVVAVAVPLGSRAFVPDDSAADLDPMDDGPLVDGPAEDETADGSPAEAAASLAAGPEPTASPAAAPAVAPRGAFASWTEPRTLLIGVFVLAFAFAEGTANDWIAVAVIDGYGAEAALGTLTFAVFLTAMTVGRWYGPDLLDRFGRVATIRVMASVSLVGLLLFIFSPSLPLALVGALLWGGGIALGFPLGMSAAADDPALAPGRVSVVASIGYVAFLAGPPLIGLLGEAAGVLRAVSVVAVLLALALLVSGSVRPLERPQTRRATTA
ncbi:MFS transporter [Pseudokineococcus marinus]|uniref:MFS transporter n=1 Tax=Pseudokineococcus marinus TaxID=351215 RepID=A0A849BR79_9ACTN|nr:MFS transporter [Pseudokineococcus marinus]NNH23332.1 MFS transporter [Pseudokineococcus marinus]